MYVLVSKLSRWGKFDARILIFSPHPLPHLQVISRILQFPPSLFIHLRLNIFWRPKKLFSRPQPELPSSLASCTCQLAIHTETCLHLHVFFSCDASEPFLLPKVASQWLKELVLRPEKSGVQRARPASTFVDWSLSKSKKRFLPM